jgi:hypothetical protein
MTRAEQMAAHQENPAMIAAWRALADDLMAFLISRGVRPTPHRYAIVTYLADHGVLDKHAAAVHVGEGRATVGRTMLRRVTHLLEREGIVEACDRGGEVAYRLRPPETWGPAPRHAGPPSAAVAG